MNHDYTHCADFTKRCPEKCFYAQLERDLRKRWRELITKQISYGHFGGTSLCLYGMPRQGKGEKNEAD